MIRWIKGDGRDDEVTRSAIAQATRLFGNRVDYCMCSAGISAARARAVLAWADQPVEWWPLGPEDNAQLAGVLMGAGCSPDAFGYWWKWFPERVRPDAAEWILDGDMVITGKPSWFDAWCAGTDALRVTQDDAWDINGLYGEYRDFVDHKKRLYSGLVSLPRNLSYLPYMLEVLRLKPLASGHDGRVNMSEQGVVVCAFEALGAEPIPLSEFPFARAFEANLNYGLNGPAQNVWGYHFGHAFRGENPHFRRLAAEGQVYWRDEPPPPVERFKWLENYGQWGVPGWSMPPGCVERVMTLAQQYAGRRMLDLGTSRGRLPAIMATYGCLVTTVDQADRGASTNLMQMGARVVVSNAADFLRREEAQFAMILADIHDNSSEVWAELWPLLADPLERDGAILLSNTHLWRMSEWQEETGLRWITEAPPAGWTTEIFADPEPGMVICRRSGRNAGSVEIEMTDDDAAVKEQVAASFTAAMASRFAERNAELLRAGQEAAELLAAVAGQRAALDAVRAEIESAQASMLQSLGEATSAAAERQQEVERLTLALVSRQDDMASRFAERNAELLRAGQEAAELLAAVAGQKAALDPVRAEIESAQASMLQSLGEATSAAAERQQEVKRLTLALASRQDDYEMQFTAFMNDARSAVAEREHEIERLKSELLSQRDEYAAQFAALLMQGKAVLNEWGQQIEHLPSELSSMREERAASEGSVWRELDSLRQGLDSLVHRVDTWLVDSRWRARDSSIRNDGSAVNRKS